MSALKGLEDVGESPSLHWTSPVVSVIQPRPQREASRGGEPVQWGALSRTGWPWESVMLPSSPHHAVPPQCEPVEVTVEDSGDGPSWTGRLCAESLPVSVTAVSPVPGTRPIPTPT